MNSQEKFAKINESVKNENFCRIHFKQTTPKLPLYGKFANLDDAKDLESKGMVRWVNNSKMDNWIMSNKSVYFTRILMVSEIETINLFPCKQLI